MILEKIKNPSDLKRLNKKQLERLSSELRHFILEKTAATGGHLASNLGSVELTLGLMRALDLPKDKIIWDVGHQCYTYKILTGRKDQFDTLRQYHGLSGFPKRAESEYDSFNTGHSSTSISAGLGMVYGRDIQGEDYTVVSVIGDGALTGGMAFEGLNNAAALKKNFVIVLNDNNMSISKNIGGMSHYLDSIRTGKGYNELKDNVEDLLNKVPALGKPMIRQIRKTKSMVKQLLITGMLFENMGLTYLGPIDG
ncbi:MAG: 1-deoxy-D-xylulose-5-phosphate synthase, partial [Lachnospiraceae bacterium]|nr:1-deoxy-D-xylulose-5-phosphate synthase [Candidatus Equihabitans merdae]